MSTFDSVGSSKPSTQDLEDILIEQLPEDDDKARQYKEAWYRFSQKLKEIFDYYDNGNLVGAQGARGPQGVPGPPGTTIGIEGPPGPAGDANIERDFIADASILVNTPVFVAGDNYVQSFNSNNVPQPIIGIVIDRPTAAIATVRMLGLHDYVIDRGELWLSANGTISTVRPNDGYMQRLGYSFGDGEIYIRPEQQGVHYLT
jgi:hypothetical protein